MIKVSARPKHRGSNVVRERERERENAYQHVPTRIHAMQTGTSNRTVVSGKEAAEIYLCEAFDDEVWLEDSH